MTDELTPLTRWAQANRETIYPEEWVHYLDFKGRNYHARDTWGTVSFEDWQRHLKHGGYQTYWGDFVKRRDKGMEEGK
jgi:hypothetical protein